MRFIEMVKSNGGTKVRGEYTTIRLDADLLERMKEWRRVHPDLPSPGMAARMLIDIGLASQGYASDETATSESRSISAQEGQTPVFSGGDGAGS